MKKILMTIAAAFVATTMSAQFYVGGSLGFNSGKTTNEVSVAGTTTSTDNKVTNFTIAPEVGMMLSDNMAIGVSLGFTNSKNEPTSSTTIKSNEFEIAPYFRYIFAKWGNVSLFADAQFAVATGKDKTETTSGSTTTSTEVKNNGYSFSVAPGISYQASEKVNFVAKLGDGLGYWHTKSEVGNSTAKANVFGINANTLGLSFGMYYNF